MRISLYLAPLAIASVMLAPPVARAQIAISVNIAPPALPVYEQPPIPAPGYLWTPGYWAWGEAGYYWVPGTWARPPSVGLLWTPGYWGFEGGAYGFHAGYWGPHVGFYGGINYGFGFGGVGFEGGMWQGNEFHYNTAVTHVDTTIIHNTYNKTVINNNVSRAAFNGEGGVTARPTPDEERFAQEKHIEATEEQRAHVQAAEKDPQQRASENHGKPAIAAASKPGEFKGPGVVAAKEAGGKLTPEQEHPPANAVRKAETKPGEAKPEEAKPGEAKPRDEKPGEAKPGESKPNEGKPGGAAKPTTEHPAAATHTGEADHAATANHEEPKKPAAEEHSTATHPATEGHEEPKKPATTEHSAAEHPAAKSEEAKKPATAEHSAAEHPAAAAHPEAAHPAEKPAAKPAENKEEKKSE